MHEIVATVESVLEAGAGTIWGWPSWPLPLMVMLLLGTGLFLTIRLKLINIRGFAHAIRVVRGDYDDPDDPGDISHFQALSTALSATVGVGNIAGVATAIHYGGPGALFWMWVTAFIGMTTKYTECTLSTHYRRENADGTVSGGPMYYIEQGLGWKPLALLFAACATISSFGSGNAVQAHTMADSLRSAFGVPTWITGSISAVLVALVIIGGIHRIGNFTSRVVPLMAVLYFVGAIVALVLHAGAIPGALWTIVREAWSPTAALGGFAGATMLYTLQWGVKRGLFSNEAGQGSAPIAHAAAMTDEPVREGSVALLEPFIDTLTICTLTGLVIVCTGVWHDKRPAEVKLGPQSGITVVSASCALGRNAEQLPRCKPPAGGRFAVKQGRLEDVRLLRNHAMVDDALLVHGDAPVDGVLVLDAADRAPRVARADGRPLEDVVVRGEMLQNGEPLTEWGFTAGLAPILPQGGILVAICVVLFALSTAIGWSYYGERSAQYIFADRVILPYKLLFVVMHFVGAVVPLEAVWAFGDLALGLMSLPNLLAIVLLSGQVVRMTNEYYSRTHVPTRKRG